MQQARRWTTTHTARLLRSTPTCALQPTRKGGGVTACRTRMNERDVCVCDSVVVTVCAWACARGGYACVGEKGHSHTALHRVCKAFHSSLLECKQHCICTTATTTVAPNTTLRQHSPPTECQKEPLPSPALAFINNRSNVRISGDDGSHSPEAMQDDLARCAARNIATLSM